MVIIDLTQHIKVFLFFVFLGLSCASPKCNAQELHKKIPKRFNYSENYPGGSIKVLGKVKGKIKTGKWFFYHENGMEKAKGRYKNGEQHGKWTYYNEDGSVQSAGKFLMGKKDGIWWISDNNYLLFDNGKLIKTGIGCKKCGGI